MSVSLYVCVSLCTVLILILFFKTYVIYFVSKLMYFCIMARNIWEANKEEAFVQEQGQNKAKFLHLQGTPYTTMLCVAFLAQSFEQASGLKKKKMDAKKQTSSWFKIKPKYLSSPSSHPYPRHPCLGCSLEFVFINMCINTALDTLSTFLFHTISAVTIS